jgi:hypothetical protein
VGGRTREQETERERERERERVERAWCVHKEYDFMELFVILSSGKRE